jgi:hypothetical protein
MEQQRPERIADRWVGEPVEVGHHIQEAGVLSVGSSAGTRRSATAPASSPPSCRVSKMLPRSRREQRGRQQRGQATRRRAETTISRVARLPRRLRTRDVGRAGRCNGQPGWQRPRRPLALTGLLNAVVVSEVPRVEEG